jgi:serine/alanine adding enzyme
MEIIHLDNANIQKWQSYVAKHPDATFYHRHEWKEIIEKSFGHKTYYLMAIKNKLKAESSKLKAEDHEHHSTSYELNSNQVVGILPIVHLKSLLFGSIFCSMPLSTVSRIMSL